MRPIFHYKSTHAASYVCDASHADDQPCVWHKVGWFDSETMPEVLRSVVDKPHVLGDGTTLVKNVPLMVMLPPETAALIEECQTRGGNHAGRFSLNVAELIHDAVMFKSVMIANEEP